VRWETRHGARTSSEVSRRAQRPSSLRFADRLAEASSTEHKPQDDQDNDDDDEPIQHGLLLIRYLEGTNHATPSRLAMLRPLVSHPQGGIFLHSIKRHASSIPLAQKQFPVSGDCALPEKTICAGNIQKRKPLQVDRGSTTCPRIRRSSHRSTSPP
jgi:hypothetical protein